MIIIEVIKIEVIIIVTINTTATTNDNNLPEDETVVYNLSRI